MTYRKRIRVQYTVKNSEGLLVEKRLQFPTITDAYVFIRLMTQSGNLIGKPIMETR